jgi:hypothetical protein
MDPFNHIAATFVLITDFTTPRCVPLRTALSPLLVYAKVPVPVCCG